MTTQTTPLTMADLGRYLGKKAIADFFVPNEDDILELSWDWSCDVYIPELTVDVLIGLQNRAVRNIRPILRPLSSVTEEEWKAYFGSDATVEKENGLITVKVDYLYCGAGVECYTIDAEQFSIICEETCLNGKPSTPLEVSITKLIDYLDSLGVDIRGYLESGKAVEEG